MTAEFHVHGPVIVGAGLAGLSCAIELAPAPCLVLSAGALSTGTSTGWAQGGLAAAIGADDSPALHAADTIAAQATKGDFDLLMMGSHGHGLLGNLVLGSVATKVMANCGVPVLIVR